MIKEVKLNSIILGDAYEVIKKIDSKSIDLIVTDPPYLISKGSSGNGRISKQMLKLTNELQDSDVANGIKLDILDEFMRIMRRYMMRIAEMIARDTECLGLILGLRS